MHVSISVPLLKIFTLSELFSFFFPFAYLSLCLNAIFKSFSQQIFTEFLTCHTLSRLWKCSGEQNEVKTWSLLSHGAFNLESDISRQTIQFNKCCIREIQCTMFISLKLSLTSQHLHIIFTWILECYLFLQLISPQ